MWLDFIDFAIAFSLWLCYYGIMRRLKQILITLCAIVGGVGTASVVNALPWQDEADIQFTFGSQLSMTLSGSYSQDVDLAITDLTPGGAKRSNDMTITVSTNAGDGYILSATVGNGTTYTDSNLTGTAGVFTSLADNANYTLTSSDFTADYWGYTTASGDSATFSGLVYNEDKVLRSTSNSSGATTTLFAIGAKASAGKSSGTYSNVVKFTAVSNVATPSVTTAAGANVATAEIVGTSSNTTTGSYNIGDTISITATCNSGYTFGGWLKSGDYGVFGNANVASTTFTVGNDDVTLTAWCQAE